MRGRDVLWWVDNEGSASAPVKGSSKHEAWGSWLHHLAHLLWAELGCRVWIEWTNTKSNPADGQSCLGLQDPWTLRQGWQLSRGTLPTMASLGEGVRVFAGRLGPSGASLLAALG